MSEATALRYFVANQAMSTFRQLCVGDRLKLLHGLRLILDKPGAEEADHLAFMIRKQEEQQLKFTELLSHSCLVPSDSASSLGGGPK